VQLNRAGRTIIMVTHDEEIAAYAKRVIRVRDGLVVADEPTMTARGRSS
jgi:ABC-type lipoprotein export system ATPase subunit